MLEGTNSKKGKILNRLHNTFTMSNEYTRRLYVKKNFTNKVTVPKKLGTIMSKLQKFM